MMKTGRRWRRVDFDRGADELAIALLGAIVVRTRDDGTRYIVRVVETEAYLGPIDRASHTYGGRRTPRVESMWGRPGTLYVYFTYGMHWCMNLVAGPAGSGQAVLVRAAEPLDGLDAMRRARGRTDPADLCSGPAKLCQALGIDGELDGTDTTRLPHLVVHHPHSPEVEQVFCSPRVGVDRAGEWAHTPLRFMLMPSRFISRSKNNKEARAVRRTDQA